MSTIDVNIEEVRQATSRLPSIRYIVNDVVTPLIKLQSTIDPRVLNQNNLRARLYKSRNNVASIEEDLRSLQTCIKNILDRYEETDKRLLRRVPKMDL